LTQETEWLFTENESNHEIWGGSNETPYVKDSFHKYVIKGDKKAVNPEKKGTKVTCHHVLRIPAGSTATVNLRLYAEKSAPRASHHGVFGQPFSHTISVRAQESQAFYDDKIPSTLTPEERNVSVQAYAGLLWTKQYYHYRVKEWLAGDPATVKPPVGHQKGRNMDWGHLDTRDIISMPDCWEYPWFAVWDLAFHCVVFALIDVDFAKQQLLLMLREWYQHPNGALPAYEFNFSDVNPPVHAWACWRVYKASGEEGNRDRVFLARVFQKLLLNFTWWVNRKDINGEHIFSGGFLGLDNIGVFDRSKGIGEGNTLEQADGTAWMGFYCVYMLKIALELAEEDLVYEDVASKFFEHFVSISDALNTIGGTGLWDEQSGFYTDKLKGNGQACHVGIRSLVGLVPFFAIGNIPLNKMVGLEGFNRRTRWFLDNREDLAKQITFMEERDHNGAAYLLALPTEERAKRVLKYVFDEEEFLSPYGIRSLSKFHEKNPFTMHVCGEDMSVQYVPGESNTSMFGGNSNWRGPIWFPMNFLLVEALERYHNFYGKNLIGEFPTNSGQVKNLSEAAYGINTRLVNIFLPDKDGRRPCHGNDKKFAEDPHWKNLVLFYEYFHGDTGKGLGANHQTGWTALAAVCLDDIGRKRLRQQSKNASDDEEDGEDDEEPVHFTTDPKQISADLQAHLRKGM